MLPDSDTLLQLVGGLYEAAADPALWGQFLRRLSFATCATSAALVMYDAGQEAYTLSSSWKVHPEATRLYQEHYGSLDLWAKRALSKPNAWVGVSGSLCSLSELGTTEVYNDYMVKFGFEHGLFALVANTRTRFASISLYRDSSCSAFDASQGEIVRFLAPHAQRAFRLHLCFSELKTRSVGLETALDSISIGIIVLGHKEEIVTMNRCAAELVQENDGILATRVGLRAHLQIESDLLAKTIRQAISRTKSSGPVIGGTVLISRRAREPLQVLVSPIRNSTFPGPHGVAAVAFIIDPSRRSPPTEDILRTLFGLTPAECRIALLLGDGHAPRKIAEMVGVSENTVRSQIKSIFSKTGVRRQSQLIRLLLSNSGVTIQEELFT